jgi:hypothetical protein
LVEVFTSEIEAGAALEALAAAKSVGAGIRISD